MSESTETIIDCAHQQGATFIATIPEDIPAGAKVTFRIEPNELAKARAEKLALDYTYGNETKDRSLIMEQLRASVSQAQGRILNELQELGRIYGVTVEGVEVQNFSRDLFAGETSTLVTGVKIKLAL